MTLRNAKDAHNWSAWYDVKLKRFNNIVTLKKNAKTKLKALDMLEILDTTTNKTYNTSVFSFGQHIVIPLNLQTGKYRLRNWKKSLGSIWRLLSTLTSAKAAGDKPLTVFTDSTVILGPAGSGKTTQMINDIDPALDKVITLTSASGKNI